MQPFNFIDRQAAFTSPAIEVLESPVEPSFLPPSSATLAPCEAPTSSCLSELFPFYSIDDYAFDRLTPQLVELDIFIPSNFFSALRDTRSCLTRYANLLPGSSRKFGKLASSLDEENSLFELLKLYRSALLQG